MDPLIGENCDSMDKRIGDGTNTTPTHPDSNEGAADNNQSGIQNEQEDQLNKPPTLPAQTSNEEHLNTRENETEVEDHDKSRFQIPDDTGQNQTSHPGSDSLANIAAQNQQVQSPSDINLQNSARESEQAGQQVDIGVLLNQQARLIYDYVDQELADFADNIRQSEQHRLQEETVINLIRTEIREDMDRIAETLRTMINSQIQALRLQVEHTHRMNQSNEQQGGQPDNPNIMSSQAKWKLRRNKALKQAMAVTTSTFTGEDGSTYRTWKNSIRREVADLEPDAEQWIDLLEKRTSRTAQKVVKRTKDILMESDPQLALDMIWEALDVRFQYQQEPSQLLIKDLLFGPTISTDTDAIFTFAHDCKLAVEFRKHNPGRLNSLEDKTSLDMMKNRLNLHLQDKWHEYVQTRYNDYARVTFIDFASWIQRQAGIRSNKIRTQLASNPRNQYQENDSRQYLQTNEVQVQDYEMNYPNDR